MRYYGLCIIVFTLVSFTQWGYAWDKEHELDDIQVRLGTDWQLVKEDKHRQIRTYAKLENDKRIRSFRVEGILNGNLTTMARVMLDFANYDKWYWEVKHIKLLKQVSPTEYYIYIIHRSPYGLPDRDVILHAMVSPQHNKQPYILLSVRASPDYLPEYPPLVRMSAEDIQVKFTPLPNQHVQIEAEGFIDPGGKVPPWDANLIQRNAPFHVILGFQRMALLDIYRNTHNAVPFTLYDYEQLSHLND